MSDERLSDQRVQWFIDHMPEQGSGALAREVQEAREVLPAIEFERNNAEAYVAKLDTRLAPIDALCARHDIDIDGIVRLVDEVFVDRGEGATVRLSLRRLARGES